MVDKPPSATASSGFIHCPGRPLLQLRAVKGIDDLDSLAQLENR
jgi:hypothetical protein